MRTVKDAESAAARLGLVNPPQKIVGSLLGSRIARQSSLASAQEPTEDENAESTTESCVDRLCYANAEWFGQQVVSEPPFLQGLDHLDSIVLIERFDHE